MDTDKKTVTFDDGSVQSYDQLLISTGCRYTQIRSVFTLRHKSSLDTLVKMTKQKNKRTW